MKNTIAIINLVTSLSMYCNTSTVLITKKEEPKCIITQESKPIYKDSSQKLLEMAEKKEQEEYNKKILEYNKKVSNINFENDRQNSVTFDSNNVNIESKLTESELEKIFINKGATNMIDLASSIIEAEKEYHINALFLSGIIIQESGWGTTPAGDNDNLTGYCVYNTGYKGQSFNGSKHINIMATAKLLREEYLSSNGKHFNGVSTEAININYCLKEDMKTTDYKWSQSINNICYSLLNTYHSKIKKIIPIPKFEK